MNLAAENGGAAQFVDEDAGTDRGHGLRQRRVVGDGQRVGQRRGLGQSALVARIEDGDVADIARDVAVNEEAVIVDVPSLEGRHVGRTHLALVVALQAVDDAGPALIDAVGLLALAQMLARGPERHPALAVVDVAVLVVAVVERNAAFGRTMRGLQTDRVLLGLGRPALLGFAPDIAQHRRRLRLGENAVIVAADDLATLGEIEHASPVEHDVGNDVAGGRAGHIDFEPRVVGEAAILVEANRPNLRTLGNGVVEPAVLRGDGKHAAALAGEAPAVRILDVESRALNVHAPRGIVG